MNYGSEDKEYLKSLKVLYVEDEEDAREQFSQFLRRIVGELVTAKDGLEGLEVYRAHHPDIIITDILMPNMDGLEMTKGIRSAGCRAPIIVLTAFEEIDYLKRSINLGVDKYLTKPVDGFQLHETLLACAHELSVQEQLRNAATTDPLTGLINRRELKKFFEAEKSRTERHDKVFSLIMIDIDHFKMINDTFGHNAGDRILKTVADTLVSSLRIQDICGRWGGEEFLVMLPETDLAGAAQVAEKLRSAVCCLETGWRDERIPVTVSLGVGVFRAGATMEECVTAADHAMYQAKIGGRNRVELAGG